MGRQWSLQTNLLYLWHNKPLNQKPDILLSAIQTHPSNATFAPKIFLFHFTLISLLRSCAWWRATLYSISRHLSQIMFAAGDTGRVREHSGDTSPLTIYTDPWNSEIHWGRGTILEREISFILKQASVQRETQQGSHSEHCSKVSAFLTSTFMTSLLVKW